jgi:uncharacterized protein (DUF305 family)
MRPDARTETDSFANDVVTAQTAEISIMRKLYAQLPPQ